MGPSACPARPEESAVPAQRAHVRPYPTRRGHRRGHGAARAHGASTQGCPSSPITARPPPSGKARKAQALAGNTTAARHAKALPGSSPRRLPGCDPLPGSSPLPDRGTLHPLMAGQRRRDCPVTAGQQGEEHAAADNTADEEHAAHLPPFPKTASAAHLPLHRPDGGMVPSPRARGVEVGNGPARL